MLEKRHQHIKVPSLFGQGFPAAQTSSNQWFRDMCRICIPRLRESHISVNVDIFAQLNFRASSPHPIVGQCPVSSNLNVVFHKGAVYVQRSLYFMLMMTLYLDKSIII